MALVRLGHEIIGACEIDRYARQIYSKHFSGVHIHDDATTLQADSLPHFDLLCAGFPCPTFSIAGQRRGFDDPRGRLFFEIIRIAEEKQPSLLLLENVKGLISHDKGDTFRTMLKALNEVGYDAEWQTVNGKHFLPQNRERIFIVGHLRGSSTRQIFPLGETGKESYKWSTAEPIAKTLQSPGNTCGNYRGMNMIVLHQSASQAERIYDPKGVSQTLSANGGGWGAKTGIYKIKERVRRLTPLECERLQGFPDGWTEGISDTQRYKCLGNAVMVPKVQEIASHLILFGGRQDG